jgi:hypothetical protein
MPFAASTAAEERQGTGSGFFWDDDGHRHQFHVIRDASL